MNWVVGKCVRLIIPENTSKMKIDHYKGCLFGLAVGDALGTTLEFQRPGTFTPLTDMMGGGAFGLKKGQWTDDTSMALCLAASLSEKGFSTFDQMERYVRWWHQGYMSSEPGRCVDIGMTTQNALADFMTTGQPISGKTDRDKAGNGSIMRLAPVPMYFAHDLTAAVFKSGISSKTTHAAPQAIDGCRYMAFLITSLLNGASKSDVLSNHADHAVWKDAPLDLEILEIVKGSFKHKNPPEIVGSGYVVKSLEAALWAFYHTDNFANGALMAANLGNDADTTAAVYGQIAGAFYGSQAIPESWRTCLSLKNTIETLAEDLFKNASNKINP